LNAYLVEKPNTLMGPQAETFIDLGQGAELQAGGANSRIVPAMASLPDADQEWVAKLAEH
jgi:hypothetical protein